MPLSADELKEQKDLLQRALSGSANDFGASPDSVILHEIAWQLASIRGLLEALAALVAGANPPKVAHPLGKAATCDGCSNGFMIDGELARFQDMATLIDGLRAAGWKVLTRTGTGPALSDEVRMYCTAGDCQQQAASLKQVGWERDAPAGDGGGVDRPVR